MNIQWIPDSGWILNTFSAKDLFRLYQKECDWIIDTCRILYGLGAMPKVKGRNGNAGNVGVRDRFSVANGFIVTGSETSKEDPSINSLTLVTLVDCDGKFICSSQDESVGMDRGNILKPSTESIVMALIFKFCPEVNFCIHYHWPIEPSLLIASVKVKYPAKSDLDWCGLTEFAKMKERKIGLKGHTNPDSDEIDGVFVFGEDPIMTLSQAIELIKKSPRTIS